MTLAINWYQRGILAIAGCVAAFAAMTEMFDAGISDRWLATLLFGLATVCFVLAASTGGKRDA